MFHLFNDICPITTTDTSEARRTCILFEWYTAVVLAAIEVYRYKPMQNVRIIELEFTPPYPSLHVLRLADLPRVR